MKHKSSDIEADRSVQRYHDGTYLQDNPTWHVEDSPWKAKKIFDILIKNKINATRVAEIGSGAGETLRRLSFIFPNTEFHGYEISKEAFNLSKLRTNSNLQFFNDDLLDSNLTYDCVLCIDVFEHVENLFPFLRRLRTSGEYKIFHIPLDMNALSIARQGPMRARKRVGHLHYFCKETALATLTECGYDIQDVMYTKQFLELPQKSLGRFIRPLRAFLFFLSPDLAVRLIGGCSLMVLAR